MQLVSPAAWGRGSPAAWVAWVRVGLEGGGHGELSAAWEQGGPDHRAQFSIFQKNSEQKGSKNPHGSYFGPFFPVFRGLTGTRLVSTKESSRLPSFVTTWLSGI